MLPFFYSWSRCVRW